MLSPELLRQVRDIAPEARDALRSALDAYLKTDRLQDYTAYPKQIEFHMLGAKPGIRNRMLRAGNQQGKTYSAAAEVAMHLTGEYPRWWKGLRFTHPITCWASSVTGEATRDNPQRALFGLPGQEGTGAIPQRCLTSVYGRSGAVTNLYDYRMIRHVSGGMSMLKFRFYAQGYEAWQGPPVHLVWFDEEPGEEVYNEGIARTIATQGHTLMTFTPKQGYTPVVNLYDKDTDPDKSGRAMVQMNIYDALHLTDDEREAEIARWPKSQRRAVIMGLPALGSGVIYPYEEDAIKCEPFPIPEWWPVIGAIDFGGSSDKAHPTAAVKLAIDRDNDIYYITRIYRQRSLKPPEVWMSLRLWGTWLKWAWPRDALIEEKSTGTALIEIYKQEGMRALPFFAQWPADRRKTRAAGEGAATSISSNVSVERGILEIQHRFETGRLQIFSPCQELFEEIRQYHRKDNKIVKEMDDLVDALRYGVMMARYAGADAPARAPRFAPIDAVIGL